MTPTKYFLLQKMAPKPKHQKTSKGKEHSKSKDESEAPIKLDHCALNFPEVLAIDHEFSLPKYTAGKSVKIDLVP